MEKHFQGEPFNKLFTPDLLISSAHFFVAKIPAVQAKRRAAAAA